MARPSQPDYAEMTPPAEGGAHVEGGTRTEDGAPAEGEIQTVTLAPTEAEVAVITAVTAEGEAHAVTDTLAAGQASAHAADTPAHTPMDKAARAPVASDGGGKKGWFSSFRGPRKATSASSQTKPGTAAHPAKQPKTGNVTKAPAAVVPAAAAAAKHTQPATKAPGEVKGHDTKETDSNKQGARHHKEGEKNGDGGGNSGQEKVAGVEGEEEEEAEDPLQRGLRQPIREFDDA